MSLRLAWGLTARIEMDTSLMILASALVLSAGLTPVARALALRLGIIDQPHPRKIHLAPVPRLGGLAMYGAFVITVCIFALQLSNSTPNLWGQLLCVLGGSTSIVLIGILDDGGRLRSLTKLVVGMPVAALVLASGGIRVTAWPFVSYFDFHSPAFQVVSWSLTLAWVVVITSAFSILDHMDGLCSGVAAIAAAFFLLLAVLEGQSLVTILAAAILGASIGFLFWNLKPASIFMGDSGALFLGFMMATLGMKLRFLSLPTTQSWTIPVLVLGVPIFDAALVIVSRIRRGLDPLITPGKDHTAHRLAAAGLGQRGATFVLYGASLALGLLALVVLRLTVFQTHLLLAGVGILGIAAFIGLERAHGSGENPRPRAAEPDADSSRL
jgi:UDP-GlcNAc:undecaprenyl-phosphate GlcNAc-1-phosphate transferase